MKETTWILDEQSGALTVEGLSQMEMANTAKDLLTASEPINCARPLQISSIEHAAMRFKDDEETLRVYRIYHGSVVEGPGRRSVAQFAGCEQGCVGCYIPETHPRDSGVAMVVNEVVTQLLAAEGEPRDGVTILGGEPFLQPEGLLELVPILKYHQQHLTVYSGYTFEQLLTRPDAPLIRQILARTDVLIDGPFMKALAESAGEWRGSTNQRILYRPFF